MGHATVSLHTACSCMKSRLSNADDHHEHEDPENMLFDGSSPPYCAASSLLSKQVMSTEVYLLHLHTKGNKEEEIQLSVTEDCCVRALILAFSQSRQRPKRSVQDYIRIEPAINDIIRSDNEVQISLGFQGRHNTSGDRGFAIRLWLTVK